MRFYKINIAFSLVLILFSVHCVGCRQNAKKDTDITFTKDPVVSFLSGINKPYEDLTEKEIADLGWSLIDHVEQKDDAPTASGIWLAGSKNMSPNKTTLLIGQLNSGLRSWAVNPNANTYLFLRHLESGKAWINTPFYSPKRGEVIPKSAMGDKPNNMIASGWSRSINKVDISNDFSINMLEGYYTATTLYFDIASNSVNFSYSSMGDSPSLGTNYPPFSFSMKEDDGLSMQVHFDGKNSNILAWTLNLIALRLDEEPIIIPVQIDLTKEKGNITIDIPTDSESWKKGKCVLYLDGGKEIKGPVEIQITP